MEEIKEKILNNCNEDLKNRTIKEIQKQVKINSARDLATKGAGAPFGQGVKQALDTFIETMEEMGFATFLDPDGYYAYAEIGPKDGDLIAVLGHLDVVPAGDEENWTEAGPFSGDIVDDKIIGRGSLDDKGPVMINVMAIKNLLESGYEFKNRIRVIVGGAEETTWECIDKYKKEQEIPKYSYAPDSQFPLINAEKTLYQFDISSNTPANFSLTGGNSYNAVADFATYQGEKLDELEEVIIKHGYKYTKENDAITIIGESAHSKSCFLGKNAILQMCECLIEVGEESELLSYIDKYIKKTTFGELILGEQLKEDVSGELTLNVGKIKIDQSGQTLGIDSRIPVLLNEDEIIRKFKNSADESGLIYTEVDKLDKLYVPADSPLVEALMNSYKTITGDKEAKPLSSGGATYSRAWDNCVAFGCVFGKEGMVDKMHQPNECFEIKYILPALKIYSLALYEMDNI